MFTTTYSIVEFGVVQVFALNDANLNGCFLLLLAVVNDCRLFEFICEYTFNELYALRSRQTMRNGSDVLKKVSANLFHMKFIRIAMRA